MPHQHKPFQLHFPGTLKSSSQNATASQQSEKPSWTSFSFSVRSALGEYVGTLNFLEPTDADGASVAAANKAEFMANTLDFPFDHSNLTIVVSPNV